jgi:hypothetical protein
VHDRAISASVVFIGRHHDGTVTNGVAAFADESQEAPRLAELPPPIGVQDAAALSVGLHVLV